MERIAYVGGGGGGRIIKGGAPVGFAVEASATLTAPPSDSSGNMFILD